MKERPILFSAPMVRAILAGTKTQTRRVVETQPINGWAFESPPVLGRITSAHPKQGRFGAFVRRGLGTDFPEADLIPCRYGAPGDRLWVREAFAIVPRTAYARSDGVQQTLRPDDPYEHDAAIYREGWTRSKGGFKWRPSIHMPRWASRILLEVVSVRVERLQEISEADAQAEGAPCELGELERLILGAKAKHRSGFVRLWQSISGPESWAANPWVWVVEFRRVTQ